LLILLLLPLNVFSQTDTQSICHSGTVTLQLDTTWNHSIMESDLILYVEVRNTMFVTQAGIFEVDVLQIIKGEYNDTTFSIYLDFIDSSRERLEKRLGGICSSFDPKKVPYKCYLGFKSDKQYQYQIEDSKTNQKYYFFMSQKDMNIELKNYLERFVLKKLIPFYFGITH